MLLRASVRTTCQRSSQVPCRAVRPPFRRYKSLPQRGGRFRSDKSSPRRPFQAASAAAGATPSPLLGLCLESSPSAEDQGLIVIRSLAHRLAIEIVTQVLRQLPTSSVSLP